MKLNISHDTLVKVFDDAEYTDGDQEELYENTVAFLHDAVCPQNFVKTITAKDLYREATAKKNDHLLIAAPIGARDYLKVLRKKMTEHKADHTSSIAALDRLMSQSKSTMDNIEGGLLGVYNYSAPHQPRPLSLDKPEECAKALEDFDSNGYDPRIIRFLARFDVKWPEMEIDVEPVPPEHEMELAQDEIDEPQLHHS